MKKTLIAFFALATTAAFAQDSNAAFGIKGGFNYNSNGKFFKDAQEIPKGPKIGYHVGLYGKLVMTSISARNSNTPKPRVIMMVMTLTCQN